MKIPNVKIYPTSRVQGERKPADRNHGRPKAEALHLTDFLGAS